MVAHAVQPPRLRKTPGLEVIEKTQPALEPVARDPGLGVVGRPLRVLDHERLERRAQESGPDGRPADAHDVRQVELALAELGRDRAADVRVLEGRGRDVARVKLVRRALMIAFLVGHRSHERDLLHDPGGPLPTLGDRDPRDGRIDGFRLAAMLGAGLGIEGLELAGAAGHPEQDAGHLPLPQLLGLQDHQVREAEREPGDRRPAPSPRFEGNPGGSRCPHESFRSGRCLIREA